MLWHVYLRNGTAFIPTVAQTNAGFFLDVDPVGVVSATDTEALRHAVKQAIGRGNPKVATPTRAAFPKPVVLSYAKGQILVCLRKELFCTGPSRRTMASITSSKAGSVPMVAGRTIPSGSTRFRPALVY